MRITYFEKAPTKRRICFICKRGIGKGTRVGITREYQSGYLSDRSVHLGCALRFLKNQIKMVEKEIIPKKKKPTVVMQRIPGL